MCDIVICSRGGWGGSNMNCLNSGRRREGRWGEGRGDGKRGKMGGERKEEGGREEGRRGREREERGERGERKRRGKVKRKGVRGEEEGGRKREKTVCVI